MYISFPFSSTRSLTLTLTLTLIHNLVMEHTDGILSEIVTGNGISSRPATTTCLPVSAGCTSTLQPSLTQCLEDIRIANYIQEFSLSYIARLHRQICTWRHITIREDMEASETGSTACELRFVSIYKPH